MVKKEGGDRNAPQDQLIARNTILKMIESSNTGEGRQLDASSQGILERYLQQRAWQLGVAAAQHNFPGEKLNIFDPTAGSDRTANLVAGSHHVTLGNRYPVAEVDEELQAQGTEFVSGNFPDVPVANDSQHLIVMNGFDLFDMRTLRATKPDALTETQYLLATLNNLRQKVKKGGAVLLTTHARPDLEQVLEEKTQIHTLGRSTQLPQVADASFDWQKPTNNAVKVRDVYTPPQRIDLAAIKPTLVSMGWKVRSLDFSRAEELDDVKLKGITLPSTSSVHQRQTYLENIKVKFTYPVVVLEAI